MNAASSLIPLTTPSTVSIQDHRMRAEGPVDHRWLVRLRWGAVAGQLLALAGARWGLQADLPWALLLGLVAFTALTNVALAQRQTAVRARELTGWVLAADVVSLTALLAASGGPTSPFTVFFIVHVALAALLISPMLSWIVTGLTIAGYGSLFFLPVHPLGAHCACAGWSLHLTGMWGAYAISAVFVAFFVGRVSQALREGDRRLAQVAQQNERLATLSAFSASAAHDLGTPLATIALAAEELSRAADRTEKSYSTKDDATLIVQQTARCRRILADISARAGQSTGEMPVPTTVQKMVTTALAELSPLQRDRISVQMTEPPRPLVTPPATLATLLANLLRNALEAQDESGATENISLEIAGTQTITWRILDRGPGLPESIRDRLGEPFLTTRRDAGGLGLGIYLARSFAERVSGALTYQDRPGGGTCCTLCLPADIVKGTAR